MINLPSGYTLGAGTENARTYRNLADAIIWCVENIEDMIASGTVLPLATAADYGKALMVDNEGHWSIGFNIKNMKDTIDGYNGTINDLQNDIQSINDTLGTLGTLLNRIVQGNLEG